MLSGSLSVPVPVPVLGFMCLEHHTALASPPGCATNLQTKITHGSALLFPSPRPELPPLASRPHPLRLSSVLGLPPSEAFPEYCRPGLAVPLLCSPVPLSQSNCHLLAQGRLQTLRLSGLRAPWRVGMCLPQADTGPSTEHGSESAPKKYWANESR